MSTAAVIPSLPPPQDACAPYTVVMVCTGNICRSAMAQIVLIDRLAGSGAGTAVRVTSAGVSAEEHGHPIDPRARQVLHAHGYGEGADEASRSVAASIRGHRASRITDSELKEADLLLAMTRAHEVELCRRLRALGSDETRVRMFRELDPQAPAQVGEGALDVQDPWYGTMSDFEDTLEVVERVCDALAPALAEVGGMTPATGEG